MSNNNNSSNENNNNENNPNNKKNTNNPSNTNNANTRNNNPQSSTQISFECTDEDYSKKISQCLSGEIVCKGEEKILLVRFPELSEKEKKFCERALEEIKKTEIEIKGENEINLFLREYCLERMILLSKSQKEKIIEIMKWETIGESILTTILQDPDFEEIVINGPKKNIMLYHRIFGWLRTNTYFRNEEKIKNIINRMASKLGRQLSYNTPILNAVLNDGSRINASMSPIAFSGINATIRKFKENPLTPVDIVESGAINSKAMAFLWMCMQTSASIMICGNTGSGKTTTLNSLFCFLPSHERIVVAEETPELMLPQEHTVKLNTAQQINIGLDELIENTFRMRPDRVIVGEIRNPKEAGAFINTMLAGQAKGSYATFHAESSEEALQRLKSFGVESRSISSLDLIVIQKRLTKNSSGTKKEERKVTEIAEIIKTKEKSGFEINKIFEYEHEKNILEFKNMPTRMALKIMLTTGLKEKQILEEIEKKAMLLEKLKGKVNFKEFFEIAERE
jgi:flagellar protein FlaI